MRRIWSLLLAIILIIAFAAPAYAAEPRGSSLGDDIVVWICVSKTGNNEYTSMNGHAWLVVENNSFVDIAVGNRTIPAESVATIGGFLTDASAASGGAYLNRESGVTYSGAVALKVTIPSYNYYLISDAVDAAKYKFYYPSQESGDTDIENAYTCVNFALEVWHAIGGATLNVTTSPKTAEALWNLINNRSHYTAPFVSSKTVQRIW